MEEAMNHLKTALLLAALISTQAHAAITVRDDDGNTVTLARPAQRILALAPHVTELLFAAGGGEKIAGVVSYSDYPEAAKKLPQVGDNRQYDMERIIAMKPDLIVVWMHGSAERQIAMLRQLKVPIYHSEPRKLADIPDSMERLGQLMGTEKVAKPAAAQLRAKLASLTAQYAPRPPGVGQAPVHLERREHHQRLHARMRRAEYLCRDEGGGARGHT
jgi:iron complex transport system substrate-binding protein